MARVSKIVSDEYSINDYTGYTTLWAVAPFARIPEDAPTELKRLTVEVQDPRRIYTIQKASRRHHFELLLDRFIYQIRYGCSCKACITTTCFSCRKRLANGAPIRRYNTTSARVLAFHMLNKDNPEEGLCPHPAAERPKQKLKPSRSRITSTTNESISRYNSEDKASSLKPNSEGKIIENPETTVSDEKLPKKKLGGKKSILEEHTTTDHRSFIQNMFETVSIKMAEWLTPTNFAKLADNRDDLETSPNETATCKNEDDIDETSLLSISLEVSHARVEEQSNKNHFEPLQASESLKYSKRASIREHTPKSIAQPPHNHLKACVKNDSPQIYFSQGIEKEKSKEFIGENFVPHAQSIDRLQCNDVPSQIPMKSSGILTSSFFCQPTIFDTSRATNESMTTHRKPRIPKYCNINLQEENTCIASEKKSKTPKQIRNVRLPPQSIRSLTIETIEFMCSILQTDGTLENHFLNPSNIGEMLHRQRINIQDQKVMQRKLLFKEGFQYPNTLKEQWKAFIEQCFFDVLQNPQSLLMTFSDGNEKLFDSQTIWYLMLQMTRVAPSLIFDSLWNVAATLFRYPQNLEAVYERVRDFSSQRSMSMFISNQDATDIMYICLHALIAAAPLVEDPSQLTNMSRIRSLGLTMSAKDSSSAEKVALCLSYEDAFTNDLAIRLARRIFMAIPTRRRFFESLEVQETLNEKKREPDILYTILNMIKIFGSRSSLTLNFSDAERDVHELRVPIILLDWARAVMLQDWQGSAEVPIDGPFGGALAMMAAIYENRQSLLLSDIHFETEYFAERLDSINMPIEWLSFNPNKKTVHLLDYPYLFSPATLINYFRAINFSKMSLAHETAKCESLRVNFTMQEPGLELEEETQKKLQDRLRTATTKFMVMEIRRTHVLLDTFNSIWRLEERELMRPLKLRLGEESGEEGSDSGGVQQEYLRLAIAEALDPDYGVFTIDSRSRMTWFQPGSPEPLWKYELIGIIMSLAVYNGLTLPVTFPKALYSKLLGEEVTELHQIMDGWPDLANGLSTLLEWDEKNGLVEDIFMRTYEFSVDQFGQPVSREMKEDVNNSCNWPQFSLLSQPAALNPIDAPLVTVANREKYVTDYIRYLTDISIRPQFCAFKDGFFTCISRRSVSLFDAATLQSLVEGVQAIDVDELRQITRYIAWDGDANHHTIKDFWSIVTKYNIDMRRKLLEFVTASDRVPVGGVRGLQFAIQRNGRNDSFLPTSYTCYGILLLPEYSSKDLLESRLAMALENSKGFGFA
ncbi:putative hect-domain-containing protein [Erysiphe neolycopersici]|uniref:HECT-type E3 ubiquitin transferase n=1 Tax=Erysiphe neolycopersici TaxID=212602 RepID=A0A420HQC6_9PEZI|nr:putative hect-domain-containing protein [Erysiphe neolycopersici]